MKNPRNARRQTLILALFASLLLLAPLAAIAQERTGSLSIDVTDDKQSPLSGVTLTIMVDEKPRTQVTDPTGKAIFDNLPLGNYTVNAEIQGFVPGNASAEVKAGQPTPLSLVMRSMTSDGR